MGTVTISDAGGNWSANGTWVGGTPPTAADDVVATATSGNLTNDITAQACRSLDFTNYTGLWTVATSVNLNIGTTSAPASNIALKCVPTMTTSFAASGSLLTFITTAAAQTVTCAGQTIRAATFASTTTGGWVLQDALPMASSGTLTLTKGTLNTNGQTVTCGALSSSNTNSRTLTLDSSVINLSGTGTLTVFTTQTSLVFSATGSTVNISNTSGSSRTFAGGALTWANLTYTNSGTGTLILTGANTFTGITVNGASRTLTFPASTTTTATSVSLRGTSASGLLTVNSSSSGTAATLSVASGEVYARFVSLKDITGSGGATFVAIDSTSVSGNTGWNFSSSLGGSLNDLMLTSLRARYTSTACLQDLLSRFETDNSLKGQASWYGFYGGSPGDFNDLALTYWNTH